MKLLRVTGYLFMLLLFALLSSNRSEPFFARKGETT